MIKVREIENKEIWESFVLANKDGNFLQSWNWGEFNKNLGKKIFRLGFFDQNDLKGVSLLIKQKAKRGIYLECPGGPLINWGQPGFFKEFIAQLKKIGEKEKCLFARVRPQIQDNLINKILFKNHGFVSAPMHLHAETTWQLDVTKSEERLLREMRKTTRYLIKKAIKLGIEVKQSTKLKDVDFLYKLQMETVARHHFVPFPKEYFLEEFKAFVSDNQIKIFKAIWQGQVLAIAFIIFYGQEAVYHYSGSTSAFPKIPTSYALQWAVIKEAKKRGCKVYNLWGIAPADNPKHRFAGVTLFKKGFGGYKVDHLHAQDLPISLGYWVVHIFERMRKVYRRL